MVLDVKPKIAMSYTWRSILKGIHLMKKGMVWRVGDGRGLNIWNDPWLLRDIFRKPITLRGSNLVTDVDELINPVTGDWDVEMVKDLLWEEDQQVILAIPIFEGRDNLFSVQSAYKVCRDDFIRSRDCRAAQGGSRQQQEPIWKKIWSLSPNKVKHFLWRMTHESHPLRCSLARRGMEIDTVCLVCARSSEDGGHLFFKCKLAKQVWNLLAMEERRKTLAVQSSAIDAVSIILAERDEHAVLMVTTLWFLWTNRNVVREEGRGRRAEDLARSIRIYANETSQPQHPSRMVRPMQRARWKRPPEGFLKVNCDASFSQDLKSGSWGFLTRDHDGDVVMTG
jgi:hypothetical protein